MISRHGFEQVDQSLREIGLSNRQYEKAGRSRTSTNKRETTKSRRKRTARATAAEFVANLKLPPEKSPPVAELARRFQAKSFLPTFGDVRYFCRVYGIGVPGSKSRASAIPRIFRFIGALESAEIQRIMENGMFSGPSRLGPIADAIRRNGRAASRLPENQRAAQCE